MQKSRIVPFSLVFNTEGVQENRPFFLSSKNAAERINNLHVDFWGTYTANRQGYSVFTPALYSGQKILGLAQYQPVASQQGFLLALTAGNLARINAETGVFIDTVASALGTLDYADFEMFRGNLFIAQKSQNPQKYTGGTSTSAVLGFPITLGAETFSNPAIVERHVNRLVYANFNGAMAYPSHIILSDDLAPEAFTFGLSDTNAAIIQVAPGDGQSITALKSLHLPSLNQTVLLIFKERSVYALSGDTPETFQITLINDSVGAMNNRCVVQVGNDVIFLDRHRITSLSAVNNSGTLQVKSIASDNIQKTLKTFNLLASESACVIHLPARQEIWFAIPTGASSVANKVLVYKYRNDDYQNGAWSTRSSFSPTTLLVTNSEELIVGNEQGQLLEFFNSSLYNSQPFQWQYQYPFFDFDSPLTIKRVVDFNAWFLSPNQQSVTINYEWRGALGKTKQTITAQLDNESGGAVYGATAPPAAVYGQDFYADMPLSRVKIPILGNGQHIRFDISGQTTAQGSPVFLGITGLVEILDYARS